jgi:integrase
MQQKRTPEGVRLRHSRSCPARTGEGNCTAGKREGCKPYYEAQAYDRRTRTKVRKSFATAASARVWRNQQLARQEQGRRIGETRKTLREAAEVWLAGAKANPPTILNSAGRPFKPSVLRGYEADLNEYVLPDLGARRLAEIGRGDLKRLVERLVGKGLSPSRVRNIVNPVRAVFREALDAEEVQVNPTAQLKLPANRKPQKRAAEPADLAAFLAILRDADRVLYATAAYAGLRRGELRALRCGDVQLNEGDGPLGGWITVDRSWDDVAGVIEPKSESSRRRVPVVRPYLTDLLEEHQARTGRGGDDLVFGKTVTAVLADPHHRIAKLVGRVNAERAEKKLDPIPRINLHDGRHTFGALLRAAGVKEADQSDYLGHSRNGVTARYTSAVEYEAIGADNMKLLAAYLSRGETAARIEQVEAGDTVREVIARHGEDPEGLARVVEQLPAALDDQDVLR